VNVGDHHTFNGDADLLVIRMKALKPFTVKNTTAKGLLVDKQLRSLTL
jgi:F5/8 type C domain protein